MNSALESAFEVCWTAMLDGESLVDSLARYPDLARELEPLLMSALEARLAWADETPVAVHSPSLRRMKTYAAGKWPQNSRHAHSGWGSRWWLASSALALVLAVFGGGLIAASAQSLPGDQLYAFKLAAESVQIRMTLDPQAQSSLALDLESRRVQEVKQLLSQGRQAQVEFDGEVQQVEGESLTVQGVPVRVGPEYQVSAVPEVGNLVRIQGEALSDGYVLARLIELSGQTLDGTVQSMRPDGWVISGRAVVIVDTTFLEPGIQLGDEVEAIVTLEAGHLTARRILYIGSAVPVSATPSVTPTPIPEHSMPQTSGPATETEASNETPEPTQGGSLDFTGQVHSMSAQVWTIGSRTVSIGPNTVVVGSIQVGDTVQVHAVRNPDGSLTAEEISLAQGSGDDGEHEDGSGSSSEWYGTVESTSAAQWVISGKTVHIDSSTEINGSPMVGDRVKVKTFTRSDGNLWAEQIEKQSSGSGTQAPDD